MATLHRGGRLTASGRGVSSIGAVRKAALVLALGLLAGALAGCEAQITPYAARVGGTTISSGQLDDALRAIADDPGYRCQIVEQTGGQPIEGAGASTYASTFSADALTGLIEMAAVHADVVRRGLHGDAGLLGALTRAQLAAGFSPAPSSSCPQSGASVVAALTPAYRAQLLRFQSDQDLLAAQQAKVVLTRPAAAAFARSHPRVASLACVAVIVVRTRAQALALDARLMAGADFATLARQRSIDPASAAKGGEIGCDLPGDFSGAVASVLEGLAVGEVSRPVAVSGVYALLTVRSRRPASALQVAEAMVDPALAAVAGDVAAITGRAQVVVDPRYGRWAAVHGTYEVVPSSGPPTRLVPNPRAATPPGAGLTA